MHQKPFLKWPGGKFRLLERIMAHVQTPVRHWHEPFLGSGAVFLNVEAEQYTLADANPDLIGLYQTLKQEGHEFVCYVKKFFTPETNTSEEYYRLRRAFNESTCVRERSALFIYMNRHGFNGLCRYNQKGIFNVPFGSYRAPYFPEDEMLAFHKKAQRATFSCQDFKTFFVGVDAQSMIYCDPPYVPLSESAAFTKYTKGGFGLKDQEDLAVLAKLSAAQGAPVLVSNHDTPLVRQLYAGALIETFPVMRTIAASNEGRKDVQEILALFLPHHDTVAPGRDHTHCNGRITAV
ncbi:MAG: DNA adenine methylase [Gammaproteobacteria bacterium]